YYTDTFVHDYNSSTPNAAAINKTTALQKIADELKISEVANFSILGFLEKNGKRASSANQRLVYANDGNGNLRLAYEYILQ
ncbi:hypothetical protein, partial [Chryseobacterium sp. SIMBA_028]